MSLSFWSIKALLFSPFAVSLSVFSSLSRTFFPIISLPGRIVKKASQREGTDLCRKEGRNFNPGELISIQIAKNAKNIL